MLLQNKNFFLSTESPTQYFVATRLVPAGGNFTGAGYGAIQPVSSVYTVTVKDPTGATYGGAGFDVTPDATTGLASFTLPVGGYQQGTWTWFACNKVTLTASDTVNGVFYWGDSTYAALNTNASTAATQATTAATQATTAAAQATTAATNTADFAAPAGTLRVAITDTQSALTSSIPVPTILPSAIDPNMSSQISLLYWLLSGLTRTFDPNTGRIYLDLSPMYAPGPIPGGAIAYYQCWKDTARTFPATTLAEVLVQDPLTLVGL